MHKMFRAQSWECGGRKPNGQLCTATDRSLFRLPPTLPLTEHPSAQRERIAGRKLKLAGTQKSCHFLSYNYIIINSNGFRSNGSISCEMVSSRGTESQFLLIVQPECLSLPTNDGTCSFSPMPPWLSVNAIIMLCANSSSSSNHPHSLMQKYNRTPPRPCHVPQFHSSFVVPKHNLLFSCWCNTKIPCIGMLLLLSYSPFTLPIIAFTMSIQNT